MERNRFAFSPPIAFNYNMTPGVLPVVASQRRMPIEIQRIHQNIKTSLNPSKLAKRSDKLKLVRALERERLQEEGGEDQTGRNSLAGGVSHSVQSS